MYDTSHSKGVTIATNSLLAFGLLAAAAMLMTTTPVIH